MANESSVLVFAYGSNLHKQRLRLRISTAVPVTVGCVCQRRFVFHKRSVDGSAKADATLVESSDERVWGVVYRMPLQQKRLLGSHESLGTVYDEEQVDVFHETGTIRASALGPARRDYSPTGKVRTGAAPAPPPARSSKSCISKANVALVE